jgi:predicted glutamine amidotransferase
MNGTPFWDDHWNAAHLFMKNGGIIKVDQVKIDLYANEIYFIHNGVELVAEKGSVQKVLLYKQQDTSKILAFFEYYPDFSIKNSPSQAYYRVLNTGKVRLLKLQKALVNTAPYDPIAGNAKKSFYAKTYYALSNDGNIFPLKSLDHANLFSILSPGAESEAWLKKNNNRLKNEGEVLSFLNYYNIEFK